jgi:hypothetical protein
MTRKIMGAVLLIAGLTLTVVLFTNGRLIFPHVIGPGTLTTIGVILLAVRSRTNRSGE